jgi:hypothetical protein
MNISIHNVISIAVKVQERQHENKEAYFYKDIFVTCLENGNRVIHEITLFSANADEVQITEFPVECFDVSKIEG